MAGGPTENQVCVACLLANLHDCVATDREEKTSEEMVERTLTYGRMAEKRKKTDGKFGIYTQQPVY